MEHMALPSERKPNEASPPMTETVSPGPTGWCEAVDRGAVSSDIGLPSAQVLPLFQTASLPTLPTPLPSPLPVGSSSGGSVFENKVLVLLDTLVQGQRRIDDTLADLSATSPNKHDDQPRYLRPLVGGQTPKFHGLGDTIHSFSEKTNGQSIGFVPVASEDQPEVAIYASGTAERRVSLQLPETDMNGHHVVGAEEVTATRRTRSLTTSPVSSTMTGRRRSSQAAGGGGSARGSTSLTAFSMSYRLSPEWPMDLLLRDIEAEYGGGNRKKAKPEIDEILRISRQEFWELMISQQNEDDRHGSRKPLGLMIRECVLPPNSALRVILDLMTLFFLAYDLTVTPFVLAFDFDIAEDRFLIFAAITALYWTLDIFLSFRTGYYEQGIMELRPSKIAHNYLRGFFIADIVLVTCDYANLIVTLLSTADSKNVSNNVMVLRMAKIIRLFRLVEIVHRVSDWCKFSRRARLVFEVVIPMVVVVWTNHLMTCGWYAIGRRHTNDTGTRWIDIEEPGDGEPLSEHSLVYRYTTAFHWSVSQMSPGSMQVFPQNSLERVYNIACLLLGVFFFSTLVSRISAKTMQLSIAKQETTARVQTLRRFLTRSKVNTPLGIRVEKQVTEQMDGTRPLTMDDIPGLEMLSMALRNELQCELCWRHLTTHPFFKLACQVDIMSMMAMCSQAVRWVALLRTENLFLAGHEANSAFFLYGGSLLYRQHPSTAKVSEPTVQDVGVDKWLAEAALWCHWRHVGTIEATAVAEAMVLQAESFIQALLASPLLEDLVQDYARAFHAKLLGFGTGRTRWPSDLEVPGTELEDLICCMGEQPRRLAGLVALESLRRGGMHKRALHRGALVALEEEVLNDKSAIILTPKGEVERVSSITAIAIENDQSLRFMQLGEWEKKDGVQVKVQLPGVKQIFGEMPVDCLNRLLKTKLGPFEDAISIEDMQQEVESKHSKRYSVHTLYRRNVFRAKITTDFSKISASGSFSINNGVRVIGRSHREASDGKDSKEHHSSKGEMTSIGITRSLQLPSLKASRSFSKADMLDLDVYEVSSGDQILYFAFLAQADVTFLNSPMGANGLGAALRELANMTAAESCRSDNGSTDRSPRGFQSIPSITLQDVQGRREVLVPPRENGVTYAAC